MKLLQFRITNYRSLVDSGLINVSDITALIGANESGKSSILQGLSSISMDSSYQYFDLTELDGVLKKFNDGELKAEEIPIVWAKFDLTPEDKKGLDTIFSSGGSQTSTFEITKFLDESYEMGTDDKKHRIPSRYKITSSQSEIKLALDNLVSQAKNHLQRPPNNNFSA